MKIPLACPFSKLLSFETPKKNVIINPPKAPIPATNPPNYAFPLGSILGSHL